MNAKTHNIQSWETTLPIWLLPGIWFKHGLLWVIGHPYNHPPRGNPTPEFIMQFIKFTYCNDRFATEALESKTTKYQPLINNIIINEWSVTLVIFLAARARATSHIPSMKSLETEPKPLVTKIKSIFQQTNTIATQYTHSRLVHKRRQGNRKSIANLHNPP